MHMSYVYVCISKCIDMYVYDCMYIYIYIYIYTFILYSCINVNVLWIDRVCPMDMHLQVEDP